MPLQEQTGIPFVHVSATIETMGDAYRKLGELLGMEEAAETLAAYCDETYAMVKDVAEHVEKANLLYITGDAGLNVIAQGVLPRRDHRPAVQQPGGGGLPPPPRVPETRWTWNSSCCGILT